MLLCNYTDKKKIDILSLRLKDSFLENFEKFSFTPRIYNQLFLCLLFLFFFFTPRVSVTSSSFEKTGHGTTEWNSSISNRSQSSPWASPLRAQVSPHASIPRSRSRECLIPCASSGLHSRWPLNMEGKQYAMRRLLIPYLLATRRHRSGQYNISAVHATDFGSSLCKSRITPRPTIPPLLPSPRARTSSGDPHEYPSIQPIMFSRGSTLLRYRARNRTWPMC